MQDNSPILTLHQAMASALLLDHQGIINASTDWEAVGRMDEALGGAAAKAHFAANGYPLRQVVRRPSEEELKVVMFPQLWGSTSLGYGGLGGAAMSPAYTVLVTLDECTCVYFGGGRLAYRVNLNQATAEQAHAWEQDIAARQVAGRRGAVGRYGAVLPSPKSVETPSVTA